MVNYSNGEIELIAMLNSDISSGSVELAELKPIIAGIRSRFPVRFSGIRWGEVADVKYNPPSQPTALLGVLEFFDAFLKDSGATESSKLFLVGDGFREIAFEFTASILRDRLTAIRSEPMGFVVVTPKADWCYNCTFQGTSCYGAAVFKDTTRE